MFEARLEHMGPHDLVKVECLACDHAQALTAARLSAGVKEYQVIQNLRRQFRCRQCDERGRVDISIE